MELPKHIHQTRDTQTLSITPIHLLKEFQQGCETNERNVASNEQKQESSRTRQTLSSQDLKSIGISYRPYLHENNQVMEYKNIPSFLQEQNTLKSTRTENTKRVHFQDEEIHNNDIESQNYPLITEKINQDNFLGNNLSEIQEINGCHQNFQQGNNDCYSMQHSNNPLINTGNTITK